jgi:ADP-heptose:LPS heptosyltransferase
MDHPPLFDGKYINIGEPPETIGGIGDALLFTGLAREIKNKYPNYPIKVSLSSCGFLFENNPNVDLFENGSINQSINVGGGNYLLRKCRFFGIDNPELRCQMFFSQKEIDLANKTISLLSGNRPTIMFCANSAWSGRNWIVEEWVKIIDILKVKYDIFQLENTIYYGKANESIVPVVFETIPGTRQELRNLDIRKIAAIMSLSKKYIGIDTAFSHLATCFGNDNYIYYIDHPEHYPNWSYPSNKNFIQNNFDTNALIDSIQKDWMTN